MCFAGGKTLLLFSPLLLLLLSVLQIWVCSHPSSSCLLVGAIRIFPENVGGKVKLSHPTPNVDDGDKNRFFQKYFFFNGTTSGPPNNNTSYKGFEETKRRVPSCPDPLHN